MRPAPAAVKGYAWVSQFNFTNVNEYTANNKKNGAPLCQILGQPYVNGLGIDAAGHVWVLKVVTSPERRRSSSPTAAVRC